MPTHDHCDICGARDGKLIPAKDEAGEEKALCEPCYMSCGEGWTRIEEKED